MALKASLEKLEDAPAALREHYKKIDLAEGKVVYQLDVEKVGGLELADTAGLLSSLERERTNGARLQRYGTITPEEAKANAEKVIRLSEENEALKKQKPGKITDDERAQITSELNRVHSEALAKEKATSEARLREVVRIRREEAAERALTDAGFKGAARILKPHLVNQIEVLEDADAKDGAQRFRVVVRSESGGERQFIDPDTKQSRVMTPVDRAREMAKDPEFRQYLDVPAKDKPTPTPSPSRQQRAPTQDFDEPPRPFNATEAVAAAFASAPRK